MVDKSMTGTFQLNLPKDLLVGSRSGNRSRRTSSCKRRGLAQFMVVAGLGDAGRQGLSRAAARVAQRTGHVRRGTARVGIGRGRAAAR